MNNPINPASSERSEVAEFLAELERERASRRERGRHMQRVAIGMARMQAANHLKGALPDRLSAPVDPARVAEALLEFAGTCRHFKIADRLEAAAQTSGDEREVRARELFAATVAGDRQTLSTRIEELAECPQDTQEYTWALIGWLADKVVSQRGTSSLSPAGSVKTPIGAQQQNPPPNFNSAAAVSPPPARLTFDWESKTITFDGTPYKVLHDEAFAYFEAIAAGNGRYVSSSDLTKCRGYDLSKAKWSRLKKHLPETLAKLVPRGKGGKGRALVYP